MLTQYSLLWPPRCTQLPPYILSQVSTTLCDSSPLYGTDGHPWPITNHYLSCSVLDSCGSRSIAQYPANTVVGPRNLLPLWIWTTRYQYMALFGTSLSQQIQILILLYPLLFSLLAYWARRNAKLREAAFISAADGVGQVLGSGRKTHENSV